jgi:hypothetical protein
MSNVPPPESNLTYLLPQETAAPTPPTCILPYPTSTIYFLRKQLPLVSQHASSHTQPQLPTSSGNNCHYSPNMHPPIPNLDYILPHENNGTHLLLYTTFLPRINLLLCTNHVNCPYSPNINSPIPTSTTYLLWKTMELTSTFESHMSQVIKFGGQLDFLNEEEKLV